MDTYLSFAEPDEALTNKWGDVLQTRDFANKKIEELRAAGSLGSSLQAELTIHCQEPVFSELISLGHDLKFVFIASKVTLINELGSGMRIDVQPSSDTKCERCWHYRSDVGADPAHPTICGRCVSNLYGAGEVREFA